jgi:hypothetical protein
MSKEKLFEYYLIKNPSLVNQLVDGKVIMSAKGFRKFFDTTYDVAYKEGIYDESYTNELPPNRTATQDSQGLKDLLNLFGMH